MTTELIDLLMGLRLGNTVYFRKDPQSYVVVGIDYVRAEVEVQTPDEFQSGVQRRPGVHVTHVLLTSDLDVLPLKPVSE